jgi:hypothetical protein
MDRPSKKCKLQIIRKFGKLGIDRAISINIVKFILPLTSVPVHDRINFRFVDIKFSAHDAFQVRSKSKDWKARYFKVLGAIKPKGLNRMAKIG